MIVVSFVVFEWFKGFGFLVVFYNNVELLVFRGIFEINLKIFLEDYFYTFRMIFIGNLKIV